MSQNSILVEFQKKALLYDEFTRKLADLIERYLQDAHIVIHSIDHRVKTPHSLADKLNKPEASYKTLSDVTDLAGVRIVTYFNSDVERISEIIKSEFEIDNENSIDKRELLDADRFGYLSLHYVVSLGERQYGFPGLGRVMGLKGEIQIRSILQHAWAEIEHDLGYKSKHAIPLDLRRRFSRLSGLLELADEEFDGLKEDLHAYAREIEMSFSLENRIDKVSLGQFIRENDTIQRIDEAIHKEIGLQFHFEGHFVESLVEKLVAVGFTVLSELEHALSVRESAVAESAIRHLSRSRHTQVARGVGLYYFCTIILAEKGDARTMVDYLERFRIARSDRRERLAQKLFERYARLIADLKPQESDKPTALP